MRYQGWARFSKKLLSELKTVTATKLHRQQKEYSIIGLMWDTNKNFISILKNDNYNFEDKIQDYNLDKNQTSTPQDMVDNLQTSPALKRGIWQSISIVQELVKFMRHAPEHIFIEFTREDDISQMTKSRNTRLNKLYTKITNNSRKLDNNLKKSLVPNADIKDQLKENKDNLASDRLMLYFLQMGKSLYSEKSLDIHHLSNYQIDHILPQSYIKDDSLENRALVLVSENQHKSSDLLLKQEIIDKNINRWHYMKDAGLMGPKKFKNLTRTQVSEADEENFISRQLVQTSQIIKNVSNILDSMYSDQGTTCVETRVHLSSDFRKAFSNQDGKYHFQHPEFVKNRDVNDFHHAQDAYLACLLGLYQMKKYPTNNMLLLKKEYQRFFGRTQSQMKKKGKLPDNIKNGWIIGSMFNGEIQKDNETGQIVWDQEYKNKVSQIFQYKQYNVTKRTELGNGQFYDQNPSPKGNKKMVSLKDGLDPHIYGGYSGENPAYITLVKIDRKKYKLIKVPIRLTKKIEDGEINLQSWIESNTKYKKDIQIIKTRIPLGQLIYSEKNGYLSLKSDSEIVNAQQLVLPYADVALLTLLNKVPETQYDQILAFYDDDVLDNILMTLINKIESFYPFYPGEKNKLLDNRITFSELDQINQVSILTQITYLLHANSTTANLKYGTISNARFGRKSNSINMENTDLIYKSITGLYESKIHIN